MKTIHILTTNIIHNSPAFNLPINLHKKLLKSLNLDIHFFFKINESLFNCDILLINSKFFRAWWTTKKQAIIDFIGKAKNSGNIVLWADTTDSSGTFQSQVLPFVDGYYKSLLLKDKKRYLKNFYGNRIFTDYYHAHFGINDDNNDDTSKNQIQEHDLKKMQVLWNASLGDYGTNSKFYNKLRQYLSLNVRYSAKFISPYNNRTNDISCRIRQNYSRNTIQFQRAELSELLKKIYMIETNLIPREQYIKELQNSKIGISPFGWGEFAYRDYEIIINGACLFKPDMSHITTWPDLYIPDETFIAFRWDMTDIEDKINLLLSNKQYLDIANHAQQVYRKYLFEREGHEEFCQRVADIVQHASYLN